MRAICVRPGHANSLHLEDVPEPPASDGAVLVRALALGICGTDREIVSGKYGWAPHGEEHLILGHESLGRVEAGPPGSDFSEGDLVVGIVRRPDPVPCPACAAGEWDMCRNGLYTERGIKQRNGYGSELFRVEPHFLIKLDPALGRLGVLLEPASVLAKCWEQILRVGRRSASWHPRIVLITGAGPVGLLAAMMARQYGFEVHVYDRNADGPKPDLARALGAIYHTGDIAGLGDLAPDITIECTGAVPVVLDVMNRVAASGIVCLAGVSAGGRPVEFDAGIFNRNMVLQNQVTFGSVNANRRHYKAAAAALAKADKDWLARLITRRVPLKRWGEAFEARENDIKIVLEFDTH